MSNKNKNWQKHEILFLKENYLKIGAKRCGEYLNRTPTSVHHKTERLGILKIRKQMNMEKFIKIKDSETAYFLGFLWADGYVNNSLVRLNIVKEDMLEIKEVLEELGEWTFSERNRKNYNWKTMIIATSCNKELRNFLIKMGYKTKSKDSPSLILSKIPKNLHSYFWLGYFDGDGCIFVHTKENWNHGHMTFSGTYNQDWSDLRNLLSALDIKYKYSKSISKKGHKCSKIVVSNKRDIKKFREYLYKDYNSQFFLKRKKMKFDLLR